MGFVAPLLVIHIEAKKRLARHQKKCYNFSITRNFFKRRKAKNKE